MLFFCQDHECGWVSFNLCACVYMVFFYGPFYKDKSFLNELLNLVKPP